MSNETPYGITKMAQLGERLGYPRVASVQVFTALCNVDMVVCAGRARDEDWCH